MRKIYSMAVVATAALMMACSSETEPNNNLELLKQTQTEAVSNYADVVYASYDDAVISAQALRVAIGAFTDAPSEATLAAARTAYIEARTSYAQTDPYRFYGGPIDDADGPEAQLNAWPLDESYIDYVEGSDNTGIINNTKSITTLSKGLIDAMNQDESETNVSCGYHAVEFLLWGQDLSTTGPGNRPYTDYIEGSAPHQKNALRRVTYLKACSDLLIDHLTALRSEWAPTGAYRLQFLKLDRLEALRLIMTGATQFTLGELVGERMQVAYDNRDQEDEHSCFSDQTHMDIQLGTLGISNVVMGKYLRTNGQTVTGKSILDALRLVSEEKATALTTKIATAIAASAAIHAPFDQEIKNDEGRARVKTAMDALRDVGAEMQTAATALGITLTI